MSSIDERVVKMTFDNDDFEKDIKTSSDSLSKFKDSLNDTTSAKGLDNVSKSLSNISFTNVLSGIESMTSKFSVFGVSAATVIQDITRKIESMAETLVSAITIDPVSAGWDEYELKMNSVAVIMNSTGESIDTVNQYLDELNEYADQTIYSFSDMTENIGKFTNAGVSLEDAVTAIRGISNEAALSGATATQASNAMYNFAQALSTGYVALIDWKSIENAQMATQEFKQQLLDTAVACGTVEETADGMYQVLTTNASGSTLSDAINATEGFRDSLSYQWLTTEVLIETLKDYGDATTEIGAKASEAATEVKTFSMLIDTLKEAMGSGWTETWENIFGDYETAKAGWTSVSNLLGDIIDNSATKRNLKVSEAMNTTWSQLQQKFVDAGASAEDFNDIMTELAINTGLVTQDMIDSMGGLENTIFEGWLTTDLLNDAIGKLFGTTSEDAEDATAALSDYQDIVTEIIRGTYGNGAERKSALEELGYDYDQLQAIVNAVWDGSEINWDNYTEEALIAAGATEEEAAALMELKDSLDLTDEELAQFVDDLNSGKKGGTELLWESLTNTIEGLSRILGSIGSAWTNVFGTLSSGTIYNVIASIENFTEKLLINEETARNLQATFRGLFSILSIIKTTVTTIASRAFKTLSNALGGLDIDVLNITAKIGNAIDRFRLWYESSDVVNNAIDAMIPLVKLAGSAVKELLTYLKSIPQVQTVITAIKDAFSGLDDEIQNGFPTLQKWITILIDWLKYLDGLTLDDIKQGLKDLFTTVKNGDVKFEFPNLTKLAETFPNVASAIQNVVNTLISVFKNLAGMVTDSGVLEETADGATTVFQVIGNALSSIGNAVGDGLSNIDVDKIVTIGVAIASIISAIKMLSAVGKFAEAAQDIGDFFDTLSTSISNLTKVGTQDNSVSKEYNNLRSIVVSITILAAAVVVLGNQSVASLAKGIIVVGLLSGLAIGIQKLSSSIDSAGSMKGVGTTVIAMAAAMLLITQAIKQLSGLELNANLAVSVGIIVVIIAALAAACVAIQSSASVLEKGQKSTAKVATTLLAFAVSIKLVVSSLKDLTKIDYSVADVALLAGMLAGLTAACVAINKFGGTISIGSVASLVAIPIALKLLVSSFDDLAALDYDTILNALPKLVIVLGELSALLLMTKLGGGGTSASTIVAMAASTLILAASMKMLATIDTDDMDKAIDGLSGITACLLSIIAVSSVMSKTVSAGSKVTSSVGTILAATVAIVAMSAALVVLSMVDESQLESAESAMLVITACLDSMMVFSKFATGAMSTIITLGVVVAALAVAVGALSNFTDPSSLENATGCLTQLMAMFGLLEVISGLAGMLDTSLTAIVGVGAVVAGLAVVIGLLSNFTDASSLATTANSLTEVMIGLAALTAVIAILPTDVGSMTSGLLGMVEALAVIAGICAIFGILDEYVPGALDTLNSGASSLGELIGSFIGGFIDGITGDTNGLEAMAESISGFIEALEPAITGLASMDSGAVDGVATLTSALLNLCKAELFDAIASIFGGQNNMETFAEEITAFGEAMASFAEATSGITADSLSGATEAIGALTDLEDSLSKSGGIVSFFSGNKETFDEFGEGLKSLGGGLEKLASVDVGDISPVTDALDKVIELAKSAEETDNGQSLKKLMNNFSKIGTDGVDDIISSIDDRSSDLQQAGEDAVTEVIIGMTNGTANNTDDLDTAAETMIEAFADSLDAAIVSEISGIETTMTTLAEVMSDAGSEALQADVSAWVAAALVLITTVADGMTSNTSLVSSAATSAGTSGSSVLRGRTIYNGYYNSGVYLMEGLAAGITAGKYKAVNAAVSVGTAALTALNEALDENSPSKKTIESGEYFDEGLAIGIRNMAYLAANAADAVGDSTLSALGTAADRVNEVLDGRMSFSPTITPVIDLSNVNSGVNAIQGMLGQGYNLDIDTAQINSLSAAMGQIQNGTGNEDVVAAITKLNRTMSKDRQNVYNLGGITYDDGSSISTAVQAIVRAAQIERRA